MGAMRCNCSNDNVLILKVNDGNQRQRNGYEGWLCIRSLSFEDRAVWRKYRVDHSRVREYIDGKDTQIPSKYQLHLNVAAFIGRRMSRDSLEAQLVIEVHRGF